MIDQANNGHPAVRVRIELFGSARLTAGRREVTVDVPRRPHLGDIVGALADTCPELVGKVIVEDRSSLLASHTFNLNGTEFVGEGRLRLEPGDRLLLFSSQAGG